MNRIVRIKTNSSEQEIARYLPSNYSVLGKCADGFVIAGEDVAGWSLDEYVIPRLASGLHWCSEIKLHGMPGFVDYSAAEAELI